jgi:WS/DGAT/MGAT family acyltransferase
MLRETYDRLTFLDSSFLMMETPTSPMHIAACATFEAGPLQTAEDGIDIDKVRSYIASRLHLIPRYRQRLAHTPIGNHPIWVDDEHFNIDYHVRHSALPKPGDERQLRRLAARLIAQHLDRRKPLWEIWILEGLADPATFVMISKVHHCMVDGLSSVDLMKVLLTAEPTEVFDPPVRWRPRPGPSRRSLVMDSLQRLTCLPVDIARNLPRMLGEVMDPDSALRAGANVVRETLGAGGRVSVTPLNQRIGPHRRLDWLTIDLADVKAVKRRLGGTLNDVVLATVAGALRRFLQRRGVNLGSLDFRVMAPVSVRSEQDHDTLGNRVSAWTVPMPLRERDPLARLRHIRATTQGLKDSKQALGAEVLTQMGEWTPSTLLALGARLAVTALPFNLIVTNVPGPQQFLYMLGAKMTDNFGFIPLTDSLCLGVVLFSYAGKLCWGFTGEWELVPDLSEFGTDVEASFKELYGLAAPAAGVASLAEKTSTARRTRQTIPRPRGKRAARAKAAAGRS